MTSEIHLSNKPPLLCLDDEVDNLDALERIFRKDFLVLKASTPQEAFQYLDQYPEISVIISDQRMPQMSGVEFLEQSLATHPECLRILLTGYTDIESVIDAVNKGQIYRYLTKPWDSIDLQNTVRQAFEKYQLKSELKKKNEQLETALKDLKQLDQAKSQFMILINHELKTPLTAILSFTGLLNETILSEEQKLFTDRIQKSSDKLKNIIDDVLLIVKGEVGLIPCKKQTVNLQQILEIRTKEIDALMQLKNQNLIFDLNILEINTDPDLLRSALLRTLHNATKFGRAQSTLKVISKKMNQNTIIEISNEGPPINPSVIQKILKPFELDENVMNHSVGMGLGLTICHTLTKALGGEIKIFNHSDGVTVQFSFS